MEQALLNETNQTFVGSTKQAEQRRFGLNRVFPPPDRSEEAISMEIDIVAIHGQDTHSPKTWVAWKRDGDPTSGEVHWLKDDTMLPVIKRARIFTYDWNANFDKNPATKKLYGHAADLLLWLHIERLKYKATSPIIFVASCFGGLLLVKALHQASESHSQYQDILRRVTTKQREGSFPLTQD